MRQQLQEMQTALLTLKESSYKNECDELQRRMSKLRPIVLPKKNLYAAPSRESGEEKSDPTKEVESERARDLHALMRRAQALRDEINATLLSPPMVDLGRRSGPDAASLLLRRRARQRQLLREAEQLELEVARLKASRRLGGQVETGMASFPSNAFARADAEKGFDVVGRIRLPGAASSSAEAMTVPLIVGREELRKIHATVMAN